VTQPLNYTTKAIEALLSFPCPGAPGMQTGMRYLTDKLRAAQIFVLGSSGELLDRGKPRPEVPGVVFKPPFPVVALEYEASRHEWGNDVWNGTRCSRRIALAWDWQDDVPPALRDWHAPNLPPGVVVASIAFFDDSGCWMPISAAAHLPYEGGWEVRDQADPFRHALLEAGRLSLAQSRTRGYQMNFVGLLPEALAKGALHAGHNMMLQSVQADLMDEANAYTDFCYALACKNVTTQRHEAPAALNRQRIKHGRLPLKDFHVLELAGGGQMPGAGAPGGERSAARSHLRRGHIRRLDEQRVTWVNSTVVRGRGFVDKVYAL
jgi:hypothetical protein